MNSESFDRWGKQLFYTTDINVGWDGKFNGEYVKQDVYVYSIKVKLEDGPHSLEDQYTSCIRNYFLILK